MTMLCSLLEKHIDGSWWYHSGCTFDSISEVESCFERMFWWDLKRQHTCFIHQTPLPQESCCTKDFKTFEFAGELKWKESD